MVLIVLSFIEPAEREPRRAPQGENMPATREARPDLKAVPASLRQSGILELGVFEELRSLFDRLLEGFFEASHIDSVGGKASHIDSVGGKAACSDSVGATVSWNVHSRLQPSASAIHREPARRKSSQLESAIYRLCSIDRAGIKVKVLGASWVVLESLRLGAATSEK